ncbi:type II toxin-antitoxin system YafQ family toxin [Photorhabdus asymbiotica]|uniref:type II toxin-antitoxin system YafQ family toxin n=1 Tax=Photorhabdus asymbiotica TaxID=291112 RepID=UPI003DA79A64
MRYSLQQMNYFLVCVVMMQKIRQKAQFKKDLKKAILDRKRNTELLKTLINGLIVTGTAPETFKLYQLKGNWKPCMECHIQPDFLLIWDVDWEKQELILIRCGSHSELFG